MTKKCVPSENMASSVTAGVQISETSFFIIWDPSPFQKTER